MNDDQQSDDMGDEELPGDRADPEQPDLGLDELPGDPTVHERLAARRQELADRDEADAEAEKYRRRVAILLAAVAVLGAWIAVLQTNAGTNESATARETTRAAVQAQSSAVIVEGLEATYGIAEAEVETLPLRTTFTQELAAFLPGDELPFTDIERINEGLGVATEAAGGLIDVDEELFFELAVEQRELALERDALTDERITWNARASQYETVITVLAVALFLIGFTLVLSRKIRPPILIPGLILVGYCFGWALWIYFKPIPDVSRVAISETATGEVLLAQGDPEGAVESLDAAIEEDDDYLPPYTNRTIANALLANPDILETNAIVDTTSDVFQAAVDDAIRALDLGGDEDITTLSVTGVMAMAAEEYEIAGRATDAAIELNEVAPALYFLSSAVTLTNEGIDEARADLDAGLALIAPGEPSGRIRDLAANYYSWLGWIELKNPELAEAAAELRGEMTAAEAFLTDGVTQTGEVPTDAGITLRSVEFEDNEMVVDVSLEGLVEDDYIAVLLFERPVEDGQWVQSHQLAYIGRAVVAESLGNPVDVARACAPVEFRADLYVEGVFVGSDFAPGVEATC